jgi:hypothetical protein
MVEWLRRWNFIERARLERPLWECLERGENPEALVEGCREAVAAGSEDLRLQLEVWERTLARIRRLEATMAGRRAPDPNAGPSSRLP